MQQDGISALILIPIITPRKQQSHRTIYLQVFTRKPPIIMTLTGTSDLYIAEVIVYLLIFPLTLYLGYRHGSAGFLGYFYLNLTCGVRIAADIVSLLPANRDATHPTISSAILSSIGLSPLLLALSGFLHEVHVRLVDFTHTAREAKGKKRWLWFVQIQIHGVSVLGMVLAIIGSVKLISSGETLTTTEVNNAEKLRSAGAVLLLVTCACLGQYALYLFHLARNINAGLSGSNVLEQMAYWVFMAMPFAGLRCVFTVIYTFDRHDSELNPMTGALWVKVVFVVLASLGAVIGMCMSGWLGQEVSRKPFATKHASSDDIRYESVAQRNKEQADWGTA